MTDARIAVLAAMSRPDWHPVSEAHGMPWGEAEELLAAYDTSRAAAVPSAPVDTDLRDRIRRAICEASGFDWDDDGLEPDEYGEHADAVLAVLPASADRAAEVWTVWPEDEPILGHYTDEVTAKLAAIEFQQDAEGPGHDFVYAWNKHGGHLELLANGEDTGFRVKRDKVQQAVRPTPGGYEATTGHAITCGSGFGMGCQCDDEPQQADEAGEA